MHRRQLAVERRDQHDRIVLDQRLDRANALFQHPRQLDLVGVDLQPARLHLGEIENRVDEHQQVLPARQDLFQVLVLLQLELRLRAAHHDSREADDRVERRAQFVRHVGQELRLVAVGDLELPALVLNLVEESHVLDRDRRLVGKGLEQRDFLLGKRADEVTPDEDGADSSTLPEHGGEDHRFDADGVAALPGRRRYTLAEFDVGVADDATFNDRQARTGSRRKRQRKDAFELGSAFAVVRAEAYQAVGADEVQPDGASREEALAALDDLVEHRRGVGDRTADHAQNFGGVLLVLQRLADFVEQPHVLDGDDCLIGKRLQHRKLLVGKRPRRESHHAQGPDRVVAADHRHDSDGAIPTRQEVAAAGGPLAGRALDIGNIDDPALENGHAMHVLAREGEGKPAAPCRRAHGIRFSDGRGAHFVSVRKRHADGGTGKQLQSTSHDGVEDRLGVGGRVADGSQDFGRRRLLLERLLGQGARTAQLHVSELALRDVAQRSHHLCDPPTRVSHPDAAIADPAVPAAGVGHPVFMLEMLRASLEVADQGLTVAREVVRVNATVPCLRCLCLLGDGEERPGALGEKQRAGFDVPLVDSLDGR